MKTFFKKLFILTALAAVSLTATQVFAYGHNYYNNEDYYNQSELGGSPIFFVFLDSSALDLEDQYSSTEDYNYYDNYSSYQDYNYNNYSNYNDYGYNNYPYYDSYNYHSPYYSTSVSSSSSSNNNDDEPDVDTESARNVDDESAELRGDVDMNDFRNGLVFFVYGQDENAIEDVEDDYDEYDDVRDDEEDDDFEVVKVDSDLDDDDSYQEEVDNLEEDENYFFVLCVEYEDEDDDLTLECGDVEDFEIDDSDNGDEPTVETDSATSIEDHSARLRGSVDMNDFEDGIVFFVYGEDEDQVDDVDNDYSRYTDIDEDGEDLQRVLEDSNHDDNDDFSRVVYDLDNDETHYFRICVEFENDDNDEVLECGDVEEFETD